MPISIINIAILLLSSSSIYAVDPSLEGFDEIEMPARRTASSFKTANLIDESIKKAAPKATELTPPKIVGTFANAPISMLMEGLCASLILLYLLIMLWGRSHNKSIADAWAKRFAGKEGVFEKNFALVEGGKEKGSLLREAANLYKLYASGRRHCEGLLAELQLVPRQDALSMLAQVFFPSEDQVHIDVFVSENSMPSIVLAVATPKQGRALQRDAKDIIDLTRRISVGKEMFPSWPVDKLWVLAEHSSIFQDLFADPKLQQMFGTNSPHSASMKLFRSLHFTSEFSDGSHKKILRFLFKLPSDMDQLSPLLDLVPLFIDAIGSYHLTPDLKKRALEARAKQADDDEQRKKRLEALQQKKLDKIQEEKAKRARMTPEARQKYEDKMQAKQTEKAMKKMSKKM